MSLEEQFQNIFKTTPTSKYVCPSRINLIGEHLDYNGGNVLPAAISLNMQALVSKRNDIYIDVYSANINSEEKTSLKNIKYESKKGFANYVFGAFYLLQNKGYSFPYGLNILINSEIPLGSGLSSSAALLVLISYIANDVYGLGLSLEQLALLSQEVESNFCGLACGIMDQSAIALGKENKCLLLNCNEFKYQYFDINLSPYTFVILKTNKQRKLTESKYNERVEECNKDLAILKPIFNCVNLASLHVEDLPKIKEILNNDVLYRRVKHVVSEEHRVHLFLEALKDKNIDRIGSLLNESHKSLKEDYEVTGFHLDEITSLSLAFGAKGARMTGAGFGGCGIALIKEKDFKSFRNNLIKAYYEATSIKPDVIKFKISNGPRKEY